jgi:pimeloyl-ACP methyl ester carboxylesterase
MSGSARLALVLAVLSATLAPAAQQSLLGTKLLVQNPSPNPALRKLLVQAKATAMGLVGDPRVSGATLRVITQGGTPADQTFPLPAAGWRALGVSGFKYGAGAIGGAVKSVSLKRSASGVVTLKVTAQGKGGPLDVVPPAPGDEAVVVLAVGETDALCAGFGGIAGGVERQDDARKWLVQRSGPGVCPVPATTTTTVHTSSTTSTTFVPTTTTATTSSSSSTSSSTTTSSTSSTTTSTLVVELNLLYVHGLQSCASTRLNAQNALDELEAAVNASLPARIVAWEAAHPGIHVVTHSARANVYTATPSGIHPSDSPDSIDMDDWEVGDPGCSTTQQGQPCTTAYEWRFRLVREINRLYPAPKRNIVLIGHSAGGRVSMDVASNTGTGGPNTQNWGVQDRIAGVVSVQGVIDEIGSSKYDVVGPTSFETACKNGDVIAGFGDSCAPGNGFCEWIARESSTPGADWVATSRRALMLTAWSGSCSPLWGGRSDGTLPYDAQASPLAVGLDMTPAPGQTWREAHGQRLGTFCHSDITNASSGNHVAVRTAVRDRLLDWLFVAAPRVAAAGTSSTGSIPFGGQTAIVAMGSACPAGEVDDALTQGTNGAGVDVVGVCRHPGFFDGDDHAIAASEFAVTNGATCNGSFRWRQDHDEDNPHAAGFWWKTRSVRAGNPDLLGSLPRG